MVEILRFKYLPIQKDQQYFFCFERRIKKFEGKAFFVAYIKVVELYKVGCQGIVQLGGLVLGSPRFVPIS